MVSEMTEFDIKRGWFSKIDGDGLKDIVESVFGSVSVEGDVLVTSYGVMERIETRIISKSVLGLLTVNVEDTSKLTDEEILGSKRKLNEFLEKATGFNAKDRLKRAKDKAKKGEL
ncbi:MAG: DUF5611 family protein [archaeon]|nr:DUF5611 family protein [archaeon]